MGVFERRIRVSGPTRQVWRELDAVIDTGADHCQIPRDVGEAIGAVPIRRVPVQLANNREVMVEIVDIVLSFDEYVFGTTAYLGPAGGPTLIGSIALGQMNLGCRSAGRALDSRGRTIVTRNVLGNGVER